MSLPIKLAMLALLVAPACAAGGEDTDGEAVGPATAETANDGKTDGELRVRAGEMSMWIDREIELSIEEGELVALIHGRTSRNLTGAFSWVPDDAFGTTTIVGPRSFDIKLFSAHEINTVLSGLPLFVGLDVATGSTRHYEARLELEVGLGRFTGTAAAWVGGSLRPVYAGPPDEPLRYRTTVKTASPSLTVDGEGVPDVAVTADGYTVAWNYPDIEANITDVVRVGFRLADGSSKTAAFELRTSRIGLTTEDPTAVWPSACEPDIFACVVAGGDLSTCGTYREVERCYGADVCEVIGSSTLVLTPLDLGFVWADARADYIEGCGGGGQWCTIETMAAFMAPECLAQPPTIEEIVTEALLLNQNWGEDPFVRGTVLDRAGLLATPLFGASYSPGGPALFQAIDAHMGGGTVEGWHLVQEQPCHNCTDFGDAYVLWYPDAFRAIVIEASHGYDS